MNFNLNFLQFYHLSQAASPGMHKHGCFELVYYRKGSGYTHIGDTRYEYAPRTFAIIRPHTPHDEKRYTDTEVFFIGFEYDDIPVSLPSGIFQDDREEKVWQLLQAMKKEFMEKRSFHSLQLNLIGGQLLLEICRLPQISMDGLEKEDRMIYALNYMKENYMHSIDLHNLAHLSGYSFDRFRHAFKERTGLSPRNYMIMKRLERSLELLSTTRMKISAIAVECGFSTPSQFSAMFHQMTGMTPKAYRQDPSALPAKPIFAED